MRRQYIEEYNISLFDFQKIKTELNIQTSPYLEPQKFLDNSKDAVIQILPEDLKSMVRDFSRNVQNEGVLLIKNFPIDEQLGETPIDTKTPVSKKTYLSESLICGVAQLIGEVFGYTNEKQGALVHNICPTIGGKDEVSSEGADLPFPFHVENLNLYPYTPSHLILFCLRSDKEKVATTYALNPQKCIQLLDHETLEVLKTNSFIVGGNDSLGIDEAREAIMPVIRGDIRNPEITVEFKDTRPLNKAAEIALNKLKEVCNNSDEIKAIKLKVGDMLILDNRRVLHSRNKFKASYDGQDRWLQRVYVLSDNLKWNWRNKLEKNKYNIINDIAL